MLQIVNDNEINKIALPATLYKYRTLQKYHIDILINNVVYFAAPNSFDDPKDCRPPENYPDKQTVYNYLWSQSVKANKQISFKERELIVNEQLKNSPILDVNRRKELIDNLFIDYCSCHGVLSVTANCENDKMWDDYADGHKGICIGFNSQKLASISGGGGHVNYCNELPHVNILKDSIEEEHIKRVYYKELKWEYEEEYRLHKNMAI